MTITIQNYKDFWRWKFPSWLKGTELRGFLDGKHCHIGHYFNTLLKLYCQEHWVVDLLARTDQVVNNPDGLNLGLRKFVAIEDK